MSVVGAILSLLFFYALFGIFLTQYLPLWMSENESAFSSQAQASMATLKSNVDLQAALGNPPIYSTPFVLSSQGVPLIAQPTPGIIAFSPVAAGIFASFSVIPGPAGQSSFVQNVSLGTLTLTLPNRYFPAQTFQMADDGVVQSQGAGSQVLAFPPLLAINSSGSQVGVSMALVQLYGNATSQTSPGSIEVYSHFLYSNVVPISAASISATVQLGTAYPCAWWNFLHQTQLAAQMSGVAAGVITLAPNSSPCTAATGSAPVMLTLTFVGLTSLTIIEAGVSLVIGVGQE
ncbi:MAG TPA: hypothetical protein VJS68_03270 [Thermoplasmata archaeon]|nr:hypothetical protein [Thermoplasmata archaeon]